MKQPKQLLIAYFLGWLAFFPCCSNKQLVSNKNGAENTTLNAEPEGLAEALKNIGYNFYLKGEFSKAITQFETLLLVESHTMESWGKYLLFYCYLAVGDYKEAIRLAGQMVQDEPYEPIGYQQVGIVQLWSGETALAIENFQRAIDFESHFPRVHFYASIAHAQLRQEKAKEKEIRVAESEYQQILKNNPLDFVANYELAASNLYWNRSIENTGVLLTSARESLLKGQEEEIPHDKKLYLDFYLTVLDGILLFRKKEHKNSLQLLMNTLPAAPSGAKADLAEIYFYIGQNFLANGEDGLAKSFFQKVILLDPKGPYAVDLSGKRHGQRS